MKTIVIQNENLFFEMNRIDDEPKANTDTRAMSLVGGRSENAHFPAYLTRSSRTDVQTDGQINGRTQSLAKSLIPNALGGPYHLRLKNR